MRIISAIFVIVSLSCSVFAENAAKAQSEKPKVTKVVCGGIIGRGNKYGRPRDPGYDRSNQANAELDLTKESFSSSAQFNGSPKYVLVFQGFSYIDDGVQSFNVESQLIRREDGKADVVVGIGKEMRFDSTSKARTVGDITISSVEGPNAILAAGKPITLSIDDGLKSGIIPAGTADTVNAYCVMYTSNDKAE